QRAAEPYPAPSGQPHWRPGTHQEPGAEGGRGESREHPQDAARPGDAPGEPGASAEAAHQGREQDAPPAQDGRPRAQNEPDDRPGDGERTDVSAPDGRPSDEQAPDAGSGRPQDGDGTDGEASDGAQPAQDQLPAPVYDDHPLASYVLRVNGTDRPVADAWIGESLLYVLRERLGLAGAKDGCSQGECGACNVQVDGRLVASCLVPAVTAAGSEVRTVEGLAQDGQPSDVQRALARCGAVQCGFCVPGMAMTVHDLLEGNPAPTDLETRQALCGNLCRCSGYRGVVDAVKQVVAEREALAASTAPESEPGAEADEPRIPHQAGPGAGGVNPSAFQPPNDQPYGQDGGQA
ncbi:2Fe-2S iron-sulfur cluster-binding protein, partial [Streptomyces thermospinosisporus]|uniref:2Fe-2S iron-sulfur cluster-binding protein n=1 Tax=Streptomyces thermospinosisporus TaxID=161482 RepID=UPI0031D06BFE